MMPCKNCGGRMAGDGYSVPLHCETIEVPLHGPDAQPVYCGWGADAWVATPSREDVARATEEARERSDELESRFYEALEEIARLRAELEAARVDAERLLGNLIAVRAALEYENGKAITDTLWMIPFDYSGTIFDYIDAAIDAARGKDNG